MSQRIPAEVSAPGEFLREELEIRGWTQADLAERIGRPLRSINEIINGKKAVTAETAIGLGKAFGTSAEYWLNLESSYRLHVARRQQREVLGKAR
jgi:HTH-type transcriptional regulator/antitoxin HigA